MSTCTSPSQRNYESPTLNMKGFKVGFTYSDFVIFQNNDRTEKDIKAYMPFSWDKQTESKPAEPSTIEDYNRMKELLTNLNLIN